MEDLKYIFAKPLEVIDKNNQLIGTLKPMNILEFEKNKKWFSILQLTVKTLLREIDDKDKEQRKLIRETVRDFDVITSIPQNLEALKILLSICFNDDNIMINKDLYGKTTIFLGNGYIDRDNFDYVKGQIIKYYCIKLPKQAPSKKLQKFYDMSYRLKNKGSQELEDLITGITVLTSYKLDEICNLTLYQINAIASRINKVKETDINVKLLCAGAEKVKLDSYFAHIDMFGEEKISTDFNTFKQEMGNFMK